jgi:hypothetical protein
MHDRSQRKSRGYRDGDLLAVSKMCVDSKTANAAWINSGPQVFLTERVIGGQISRNACGTAMLPHAALDQGAPIHLVPATFGHGTVATTSSYLHASPGDSSAGFLAVPIFSLESGRFRLPCIAH